jgi:tRNA pseudouridine55 synthase
MPPAALEGILPVQKPSGVTSHDVVRLVRRKLGVQRVGHTGTLDPMAQGLLILLVGRATKLQQAFQGHDKTYDAVMRLGLQTDTGDALGAPVRTAPVPALTAGQLEAVLASFQGPLLQTPPAYSAVKVQGRPAYWWARRQQPVALSARTVRIHGITLQEFRGDAMAFRVHCSSGTYIRTLAESIAERAGTVGHLTGLVRLQAGEWRLEEAKPMAWVADASRDEIARELRPVPVPALR